jgi:REP element-mobilizing transposase RayT
MGEQGRKGWYSRGYLPHFDSGAVTQMVTFRLANSVPRARVEAWRTQLRLRPAPEIEAELRRRIERYLDRGYGDALLRQPRVAEIVQDTLLHFDGQRYALSAWVVMPNHVHAVITPLPEHSLPEIMHAWKSFTAHEANRVLSRRGAFWHREYFDRFIRDARHFEAAIAYVENNPVSAGLCGTPNEWAFSSARQRVVGGGC